MLFLFFYLRICKKSSTFVLDLRKNTMKKRIHELWIEYRSELHFGLTLLLLTMLSYWLGTFIPEHLFESLINPFQYVGIATICFFGIFLLSFHSGLNRIRRSWRTVLLIWGCIELLVAFIRYGLNITAVGGLPSEPLYNMSVIIGNILASLLFIYPTQILRPGWLNWRRIVLLVLPMIGIGLIDYFLPVNLIYLIMIYPAIIFVLLCRHVRKYRKWCEDNFSSLEDIDAQWIVRYLTMLLIAGASFYFIVFFYLPNRMFTQQWMFMIILAYTTERVLYRPDPWEKLRKEDKSKKEENVVENLIFVKGTEIAYRTALDEWINKEKPYLNPDFQLGDLRHVLPVNRTYQSQFINAEYGCSFYHWVNSLRIKEAQRMMIDHPELKLQDIAELCGFSSRSVFSRSFAREMGCSPSDWIALRNPHS